MPSLDLLFVFLSASEKRTTKRRKSTAAITRHEVPRNSYHYNCYSFFRSASEKMNNNKEGKYRCEHTTECDSATFAARGRHISQNRRRACASGRRPINDKGSNNEHSVYPQP